jgi:hypothetical protein
MTRCRSAIRVHLAQTQSLHLQYRLCPLRADTTPWFRHRAHLGVRWYRSVARRKNAGGMAPSTGCCDINAVTSIPLGRLMSQRGLAATHAGLLAGRCAETVGRSCVGHRNVLQSIAAVYVQMKNCFTTHRCLFNLLKHQQFNIQQLYALPTLYLCVLCFSENKQRLVPLTA